MEQDPKNTAAPKVATNENGEKTNYSAKKPGIIGLGLYLLAMGLLCVVSMAVLMMAENPPTVAEGNKNFIHCGNVRREIVNGRAKPANANTDTANAANTNKANAAVSVNNASKPDNTPVIPTPAQALKTPPANKPVNQGSKTEEGNKDAQVLPAQTPPSENEALRLNLPEITVPPYLCINTFDVFLSADSYVFLIILFAGALGGVTRGMWSFFTHLGMGNFSFRWTWYYLLIPFSGATLSLVIYFVIRGGFYGATFGKGLVLNVFSFAALAGLTGLFSEHALKKLKQLATTLLGDVPDKVNDISNPQNGNGKGKVVKTKEGPNEVTNINNPQNGKEKVEGTEEDPDQENSI